ncbi:hypothetical protein ES707_02727 [subsurface metagenome]
MLVLLGLADKKPNVDDSHFGEPARCNWSKIALRAM